MCLYAVSLCGCVAVSAGTRGAQKKTTDSLEPRVPVGCKMPNVSSITRTQVL